MKHNELKQRMVEYWHDDNEEGSLDPAVAGTPEIKEPTDDDNDYYGNDLEEDIRFIGEVEILIFKEDGDILDETGNMFFEDEKFYYYFEADKAEDDDDEDNDEDNDGIDDDEDDYNSEDDVYPDDSKMSESLLEYKLKVQGPKEGDGSFIKTGLKRIGEKMSEEEKMIKAKMISKSV